MSAGSAHRDGTGAASSQDQGLDGRTPMLMADGRTRPLRALRPGDRVYGTRMEGRYRRYMITEVVRCQEVLSTAFLVTLEDGTRLALGADQRLLSDRGWKHVTGTEQGGRRRPHLTANNSLLGVGHFAAPPERDDDYRRGYLCGMVRGDGTIGHYPQGPPGRSYAALHLFRLALTDLEALHRTRRYLAGFDVQTREFTFAEATGRRRRIDAIRAQSAAAVARVEELISWPALALREEWRKGFLAGVFDAEGSCSGGILRISNSDRQILRMTDGCLRHFGFRSVREEPRTPANVPVSVIRLTGGLRERMRFFHAVDPAITRKTAIEGMALKSDAALGITAITPLGLRCSLHTLVTAAGDAVADGIIVGAPRASAP